MSELLVHILDDDKAVLRSLGRLLSLAGHPVRLYDSGAELIAAAATLTEGCILVDLLMPGMNGLALVEELRRRGVVVPAIVMTGQADVEPAMQSSRPGSTEFLEKPFNEEQLLKAIKGLRRPLAASRGLEARQQIINDAAERIAGLSKRERQVLAALARGDAHKVIAYDLGISVRTVEVHSARMLRRLGVPNLAQAIRLSAITELLEEDPVEDGSTVDNA